MKPPRFQFDRIAKRQERIQADLDAIELMTKRELAAKFKMSPKEIAKLPIVKLGPKTHRYPLVAVREFVAGRTLA